MGKSVRTTKIAAINIFIFCLLIIALEIFLRVTNYAPVDVLRPSYCNGLLGDYSPSRRSMVSFTKSISTPFTTNSQGFRSLHEYATKKGQKTIRILCLGDSFTLGFGLDDHYTYPELLRQALERRYPGINFEIFNAGLLLSNVLDHMDYYLEKGHKLNPDIVIIQFYINDIFSDMERQFVYRAHLKKVQSNCKQTGIDSFLQKTAIYNAAAKLATKIRDRREILSSAGESTEFVDKFLVQATEDESKFLDPQVSSNEENTPKLERIWDKYAQALLYLSKIIKDNGSLPVFFIAPNESQLRNDFNAPECYIEPILFQNDIGFIEITKVLRKFYLGQHEDLYIKDDEHTNEKGNTIIAETIANYFSFHAAPNGVIINTQKNKVHKECNKSLFKIIKMHETFKVDSGDTPPIVKKFVARESGTTHPPVQNTKDAIFIERDDAKAAGASIAFDIELARPVKTIHILVHWKLFNDKDGIAKISLNIESNNETNNVLMLLSDKSQNWTYGEIGKLIVFDFAEPTNKFTLDFNFYGKSGILMATTLKSNQERSLEISAYNEQ